MRWSWFRDAWVGLTCPRYYDHKAQHAEFAAMVKAASSSDFTPPVGATSSPARPAPTVPQEFPMSLKSILATFGGDIAKVVTGPITYITNLAKSAEPVVDKVFPGYANLYNSTVGAAVTAEAIFVAAGKQSGTGTQKLAYVVSAIEEEFNAYWTGLGNTTPAAVTTIETWVNSALTGLNLMQVITPAPTPSAPASTPAA